MSDTVISDWDILGGIPVFVGTRVPVQSLFDYLKTNHPLDDFLEDFPSVRLDQVLKVLAMSEKLWQERALS